MAGKEDGNKRGAQDKSSQIQVHFFCYFQYNIMILFVLRASSTTVHRYLGLELFFFLLINIYFSTCLSKCT